MTEEKKKSGEISRREFLKDAGLLVGGTAIGSTVLLAACGGETVTETVDTTKTIETTKTVTTTETVEIPMTFPASEGYIVVDSTRCYGCQACMLACSMVHEGVNSLSLSRIQVMKNTHERFPNDIEIAQCRQCVNPLCVQACPTGACHVDTANGNVRVIDESICIGCKQCNQACPFMPHRALFNPEKNVAMKCDLCLNTPFWDEEGGPGGKQACVEACSPQQKALRFVSEVPSQQGTVGYNMKFEEPAEQQDASEGGH